MDLVKLNIWPVTTPNNARKSSFHSVENLSLSCHFYLPHKSAMFVGCQEGPIVVWKPTNTLKAETVKCTFTGHLGAVYAMDYLHDWAPGLLVSCGADRTIKIWDVWERELKEPCVQTLVGHGGSVVSAVGIRGFLVTCSTDGDIRIWRSDPDRHLLKYPWFETVQIIGRSQGLRGVPTSLGCLKRAEYTHIYIGDDKGHIYVLLPVIPPREKERKFLDLKLMEKAHELGITEINPIHQESIMLTVGFDQTVKVHDALTGNGLFATENPNRCRFTSVIWNQGTQEFIVGDESGHIQVWNMHEEKCLKNQPLKKNAIQRLTWLSTDRFLLATSECVELWSIDRALYFRDMKGHQGAISHLLLVGEADKYIFSASLDNTIRCWDSDDLSCISVIKEKRAEITCLLHIPDSPYILSGHEDGSLKMWNTDSGSCSVLEYHTAMVSSITFYTSTKKEYVLSSSYDGSLAIWDFSRRKLAAPVLDTAIKVPGGEVTLMRMCPLEDCVVLGCSDRKLYILDLSSKHFKGTLSGHAEALTCLVVDGVFVFGSTDDGLIYVWDLTTRFLVKTLQSNISVIRDMHIIRPSGLLCVCSLEGHIAVWDYISEEIKMKQQFKHQLRCVLYHEPKGVLCVGTEEGTILLVPLAKELGSTPAPVTASDVQELSLVLENLQTKQQGAGAVRRHVSLSPLEGRAGSAGANHEEL